MGGTNNISQSQTSCRQVLCQFPQSNSAKASQSQHAAPPATPVQAFSHSTSVLSMPSSLDPQYTLVCSSASLSFSSAPHVCLLLWRSSTQLCQMDLIRNLFSSDPLAFPDVTLSPSAVTINCGKVQGHLKYAFKQARMLHIYGLKDFEGHLEFWRLWLIIASDSDKLPFTHLIFP